MKMGKKKLGKNREKMMNVRKIKSFGSSPNLKARRFHIKRQEECSKTTKTFKKSFICEMNT